MNKRIEELSEQAGYTPYDKWTSDEPWEDTTDLQKFAELIIEECLAIASKTHETKYGKMSCANDDETVRLIKERFGVE